MDNILRLVGLAKRGGNLEAGEEPVGAAARARDARVILVASDAAENTYRRVRHFADAGQCIWLSVPYTKDEMGASIGRSSCAMVAVTDIGLASAIVNKLAEKDPDKYSLSAERMALKAQRAQERREEAERHEKNVRTGRKKKSGEDAPAEKKSPAKPGIPASKKPAGKVSPKKKEGERPFREKKEGEWHGRNDGRKPGAKKPYRKPAEARFANSRPVKKGKGSVKK